MNISSNLLTALVGGAVVLFGTLANGYLSFRKNKNDFATATWDNWRKDNDQLSKQLESARTRNTELVKAVEIADDARKTEKAEKEKAVIERDTLRAACAIFAVLYDECLAGRPPSPDKLAILTTRLLDVGYVFRPEAASRFP